MTLRILPLVFACAITMTCTAEIGDLADDDAAQEPNDDPPPPPTPPSEMERCDGLDNDFDARVDESCNCPGGTTQSCYGGLPEHAGVGQCNLGSQVCAGDSEFGSWGGCDGFGLPGIEDCDDGVDNDCNGGVDDCETQDPDPVDPNDPDPPVDIPLFLVGDCITASCPPAKPYPIACNVLFTPGDNRGCVASRPDESVVYFQAGDECDKGLVVGTLVCGPTVGGALSPQNCPINKPVPMYPSDPSGCPEIQD